MNDDKMIRYIVFVKNINFWYTLIVAEQKLTFQKMWISKENGCLIYMISISLTLIGDFKKKLGHQKIFCQLFDKYLRQNCSTYTETLFDRLFFWKLPYFAYKKCTQKGQHSTLAL